MKAQLSQLDQQFHKQQSTVHSNDPLPAVSECSCSRRRAAPATSCRRGGGAEAGLGPAAAWRGGQPGRAAA